MLRIEHLSAGYGKLMILHEVELALPAGQFTAILGPNGSGKSTLLKSIMGLTEIRDGEILLDNRPIAGMPTESMAALGVAYVPQRGNVFTSMSVGENLDLAARDLDRPARAQAYAELDEIFPLLRQRRGQRAGKLSGGERQMLAIALGWLLRPRLMLLDESSAGLSPLLVTEIFRTLKELCTRGITLGVVEQNARSVLRWCDGAYVLREGRVVFHGTAHELHGHEEMVKSYLGAVRVPGEARS
jgi:ABC-type branched-subunit amino acid transport system ATPase component